MLIFGGFIAGERTN
jgi:hypothetical protein